MTAPKQEIKTLINALPEDASYDEILRELVFAKMIHKGLEDSKNAKTLSNKQMQEKIAKW